MILGHCMSGLQRPQPIFLSQDSQSMNASIKPEMNTLFLSHLLGIANPWEFHLDNETTPDCQKQTLAACFLFVACFAHNLLMIFANYSFILSDKLRVSYKCPSLHMQLVAL